MEQYLISAAFGWGFGRTADFLISNAKNLISNAKNFNSIDTGYLNHAPHFCNKSYHAERCLGGHLPYREEKDFSPILLAGGVPQIKVETSSKTFFTHGTNLEWAAVRSQAYAAYRGDGHAKSDSTVVRVSDIEQTADSIELKLQPTHYFCQTESNLVLDYQAFETFEKDRNVRRKTSMRSILSQERPGRLPKISDSRLANSLGVSVCLLSKDQDGSTMLRMVNRVKNVGVFPSGVHPAMSCAIEWENVIDTDDLLSFVMNDVEYEMQQETGLVKGEYETPLILSFCREFLRGGKPQLFLLSYTDLSQEDLNKRRDEQIKKNKEYRPEKIEMKGSSVLSSNDPSIVVGGHSGLKFTHEGAASYYLVDRLLSQVPW